MHTSSWVLVLLATLPLGAMAGCVGKAPPAPPAGFASTEGMHHNPALPFHRVWRDPSFDWRACRFIRIAEVDTGYLLEHTWWQGFGRGSKAHADAVELAVEFRQRVIEAFRNDPQHRLTVVDSVAPGAKTLELELAIVELVPHKALIQALTYPAGPFGILARQSMDRAGATSIAMEGRVRDAATGRVIAKVADREQKKAGLINIKNFTWYAHVREIIDEWATQFRQVANKAPDDVVPDTPAFRLLPW
ncbi:MAG: DUF3313 family protein [Planctomycetes bacterium]|nr:DUF3313 family protein [Planctomycetota bacterium]MCB9870964.1 DUF3313 family protein [Planctomycetota bacterium]MCB9888328.1 DUF3313 family protein [Planctomycetota bacterium]